MLRCYITDRRLLAPGVTLVSAVAQAIGNGANWIQIREKDLSSRELYELTARAVAMAAPTGVKILVNARFDIAIAAGAAGVHLPGNSPSPNHWRSITPPGFLVGISCHTITELRSAQEEGADYVVFGPVFPPRSKSSDLAARGLAGLESAARAVKIPVLALGGITDANAEECAARGAAGIAAITLFQDGPARDSKIPGLQ